MIRSDIQTQISPPVSQPRVNFSDPPEATQDRAIDSTPGQQKASFKDLLTNSMDEVKKEREEKKNNDYSKAKTDEEFLQKLSNSTNKPRVPKNTLDKDDFLKLFVTQLQHQDPLNPDDGAEMASKLAQFNSLEQMMNMNQSLSKMVDAQNGSKLLQKIQYLGKQVMLNEGRVKVASGKPTAVSFSAEIGSSSAIVAISDSKGNPVREIRVGMMRAGTHSLLWDGNNEKGIKVPDGIYTYQVLNETGSGEKVPMKIKSAAKISGLDLKGTDEALYSNLSKIDWDKVVSIGLTGSEDLMLPQVETPSAEQNNPEEPANEERPISLASQIAQEGEASHPTEEVGSALLKEPPAPAAMTPSREPKSEGGLLPL